jgi:capsular exopolysaccharide synthesis family protein
MKSKKRKPTKMLKISLQNYPSDSRFAEAYRTLRTNIHFSFLEKEFRSILITSTGQSEGKTTTAFNLAFTMSQTGKSVVMIDADLRRPMLSKLFPSEESLGLTGLLSDVLGTDVGEGSLEEFGVSDLFRLISLQKRNGLLQLSNETDKVELLFLQGHLTDLNWISRPEDNKLANTLIKDGLATKENIKSALQSQKDTGQKLGFILINMGLIKEDDLKGILTIHMMEGFRIALQMKKGEFHFTKLPESDFDHATFDPVDFQQLYNHLLVGKEELPYLQGKINSSIVDAGSPNLFLLPSGNLPPNPSELLGSERMSFLISRLKRKFEVLVFDTPPILPASDSLLVAPQTDGAILVVKAGLMNRELVKNAVESLNTAHANVLGIVLNQVDVKREGYYKYYHKYYSSYYGEKI